MVDIQDVLALSAVALSAGWLLSRFWTRTSEPPACGKCAPAPVRSDRGRRSARLRVL